MERGGKSSRQIARRERRSGKRESRSRIVLKRKFTDYSDANVI